MKPNSKQIREIMGQITKRSLELPFCKLRYHSDTGLGSTEWQQMTRHEWELAGRPHNLYRRYYMGEDNRPRSITATVFFMNTSEGKNNDPDFVNHSYSASLLHSL
jgi:hypothetical protein